MEKILQLGGKFITFMNKREFTKKIVRFLIIRPGFRDFVYRNRYHKKETNMKCLIENINYYVNNKKRIDNILNILEDEKSKLVYKSVIDYRCYRYRKDINKAYTNDQYYPKGIINLSDNEVYIDVGPYDGRTVKLFVKKSKGKYKKIVCLEADPNNYQTTKSKTKKINNIELINKGLYSESKKMKFENTGTYIGKISDNGDITIEVTELDKLESCKDATFVKMDIEGAELEALKGAKQTIKKNKPKLAICIYHSKEDMIDIIEFIHKLVPEYKLYIRHHGITESETVLYAIK